MIIGRRYWIEIDKCLICFRRTGIKANEYHFSLSRQYYADVGSAVIRLCRKCGRSLGNAQSDENFEWVEERVNSYCLGYLDAYRKFKLKQKAPVVKLRRVK